MAGNKRKPASNPAGVTTAKSKRLNIRTWTKDEEREIAEYIAEHPYLGKDQAKETLAQYLRKMMALAIGNCDSKQMSNKYTQMKKKYDETFNWINNTGQGVKNDDPESFPDKVRAMCPYYYIVDTVWATSQAINTSYQRDLGDDVFGNSSENHLEFMVEFDEDDAMDPMNQSIENEAATNEQINLPPLPLATNPAPIEEPENIPKDSRNGAVSKFESALSKKLTKTKSTSGAISEFLVSREENRLKMEENKLNWGKEKFNLEQASRAQERDKELELERTKAQMQYDLEMKKLEIEREIELRKLNNI